MDTPTCDVRSCTFSKRLVTANHIHTWWPDASPLMELAGLAGARFQRAAPLRGRWSPVVVVVVVVVVVSPVV